MFVKQSKYAKDLIQAGMDSCKPANTSCKPYHQMLQADEELLSYPSIYGSLVGSLG